MDVYVILLVVLIVGLFVCVWNGKIFEGFGSGAYTSDGYYRVSWTAPTNTGGESVTYNLQITDGSGNVVDNKTGITNTYYDFKDGEWSTDYSVAVTASNSAGAGDAAKAMFTSGDGPDPAIVDFDIAGFYIVEFRSLKGGTSVVPQPTVNSFKESDGSHPQPVGFIVDWNDSTALNQLFNANTNVLNSAGSQFNAGSGDLSVTLSGTYTSISGNSTTLSFANKPFVGTGFASTQDANSGFIGLVIFDNYTAPITVMGGDVFDVTLQFTNKWGTTSFSKTFTIDAITPAAPSAVKVEWQSK